MSQVEGLQKSFGEFSIDIPSWTIPDHGVSALSGPSGAGKTTIFRMLIGLEPCPGLKWIFNGEDLAKCPVPARRLGVVFQTLELFPHMSARENLRFAAEARGLPSEKVAEAIESLAKDLNMGCYLDRPARVLSVGESQRVALARAVIGEPRFLFLDEPFSALDQGHRSEARDLVKSVIQKRNIPTLLITHDEADIQALAQTVFKMADGRLLG